MEVIQEYSENRYYLNALSTCARVELELRIEDVDREHMDSCRAVEQPNTVFLEPLGRLFFRFHLLQSRTLETLMCTDEIEEFDKYPEGRFKTQKAKQIITKYINADARQQVALSSVTRDAIVAAFADKGGCTGLFRSALRQLKSFLRLSCFPAFLQSTYYKRLLSFRLHGMQPVKTDDFEFLRVLGEGGFGKVFAVSKKDTKAVYACKTMNKLKIAERQREKLIMNERNILAAVHHPFIVNMKYAFQDDTALHLMLDLMSGGELQFHLNRFGTLSEELVVFYAAGLVLAIGYLHAKDIVYRDLKPENVMLDAEGYIRLTDLGLCSFIKDGERLHRHCGTRAYMAPEQCSGPQGYGKEVDWWSLGVTILHLLTGKNMFATRFRKKSRLSKKKSTKFSLGRALSFRSSKRDLLDDKQQKAGEKEPEEKKENRRKEQLKRFEETIKEYEDALTSYQWSDRLSDQAKSLCKGLMTIDVPKRLGTLGGVEEIKAHPFFAGVDWLKLMDKHISPPFRPDSNYVNAEYHEATVVGLAGASKTGKNGKGSNFEGFEYISPLTFQDEVMSAIHDKSALLRPIKPKRERKTRR